MTLREPPPAPAVPTTAAVPPAPTAHGGTTAAGATATGATIAGATAVRVTAADTTATGVTVSGAADGLRAAAPDPGVREWWRRRRGAVLRAVAGALILAGVLWWYPLEAFTAALAVVDAGAVAAALALGAVTTVLCAARWRVVARAVGLRLSPARAVADYYLALLLNALLPAGILGDAHRAIGHGRANGDLGRGVRAVVLERLAGQAVLSLAVAVLVLTLPSTLWGPGWGTAVPSLLLLATAAALLAALARVPRLRASRAGRFLAATVRDVRTGLLGRAPAVLALSAAALAGHVSLFLVAAHLVGVDAPPLRLVPLALLALAAMSLPVNVGGWGPREAATAAAFGAAGLGAEQGVTVSVVYGLLALVAALPGLAVLVARLFQGCQMPGGPLREEGQRGLPLGGARP
ncbi:MULTISPECIES: lysylphosphatidylglycerol synthase domain-containing protein [unclassified Nocardiopsis]|uniref:lysylphosphatidylglycerol synthase domain-containing protein n=1 Tax=Nocardiopsis TaxID=2013 RepID=UPI00387AD863